jgi:methionyl-tRNA formyltransferase
MGTPDFAVPALETLSKKHDIVAVYTQAPKPAKRGMKVQLSPVHEKANELKIPVFTPSNFKSKEDVEQFQNLEADIAVVCAYGLLLPLRILNAPKYGCINIHASLLPKYRGADPIRKAIINNEEETGITIMKMDIGMDTGDMLAVEKISIDDETEFLDLHNALADIGAYLIEETLDHLNTITPIPQDNYAATYAPKLDKKELLINWDEDAFLIDRKIRAYMPAPCAYFIFKDKRYKVLKATAKYEKHESKNGTTLNDSLLIACGDNTTLQIEMIQPEGKSPTPLTAFLTGNKIKKDSILK